MHSQFELPESSAASLRLEHYMQEISTPLPTELAGEWRSEALQHLQSSIAAYEELGMSRDEAIEAALLAFGPARRIGAAVARESAGGIRHAIGKGIVDFAAPTSVIGGFMAALVLGLTNSFAGESYLTTLSKSAAILFFLCPLLGGWNIGRKAAAGLQAGRELFVVAFLSSRASLPVSLVFLGPDTLEAHVLSGPSGRNFWAALLRIPLAVVSAGLAGQWRNRRSRPENPRIA